MIPGLGQTVPPLHRSAAVQYLGRGPTPTQISSGGFYPTLPSGLQTDDIVFIFVASANGYTYTPGGWTTVASCSFSNFYGEIYGRRVPAGGLSAPYIQMGYGIVGTAITFAYRGCLKTSGSYEDVHTAVAQQHTWTPWQTVYTSGTRPLGEGRRVINCFLGASSYGSEGYYAGTPNPDFTERFNQTAYDASIPGGVFWMLMDAEGRNNVLQESEVVIGMPSVCIFGALTFALVPEP